MMDRNPNPFLHIRIHYQGTVVYKQIRIRKVFQAPSQLHSKKCGLEGRSFTFCIFLFRKEGFPSFFLHIPLVISLAFAPSFPPICYLPCLLTCISGFSFKEINFSVSLNKRLSMECWFWLSRLLVSLSKNRMFLSEAQRWSCCKRKVRHTGGATNTSKPHTPSPTHPC